VAVRCPLQNDGVSIVALAPEIAEERAEILLVAAAHGARKIRVRDYFGIDMDEVWAAVERDLPPLKAAVLALLGDGSTPS
jgi:uncharacterized protein with HEPN domain